MADTTSSDATHFRPDAPLFTPLIGTDSRGKQTGRINDTWARWFIGLRTAATTAGVQGPQGVKGADGAPGAQGATGVWGGQDADTLPLGDTTSVGQGIFPWTPATFVTDALINLNNLLGVLAPAPPGALTGTLGQGPTTYLAELPTGLPAAWYDGTTGPGGVIQGYHVTSSYVLTSPNPSTSFGCGSTFEGDTGMVSEVLNGEVDATRQITDGTGMSGALIVNDISTYNEIWRKANAEILWAPSAGWVKHKMTYDSNIVHQDTSETELWYDPVNAAPVITGTEVTENSLTSSRYLSGVRYYYLGDTFDMTSSVAKIAESCLKVGNPVSYEFVGPLVIKTIDGSTFAHDGTYVVNDVNQAIGYSNVYSIDARLQVIGQKPSGITVSQLSPSENRLVNTYPTELSVLNDYSPFDEYYRLPASWNFDATPAGNLYGNWNSSTLLSNGNAMLYNGKVWAYPNINFSSGYLPVQSADYTSFSGDQGIYWGFNIGNAHSSATIYLPGLTNVNTQISAAGTGNLNIQLKLPGVSAWLDCGRSFGDGPGCRVGTSSGSTLNVSFGLLSTTSSSGYVYMWVTVKNNSAAQAVSIQMVGN